MDETPEGRFPHGSASERYVIAAERVFDGTQVLERHAVTVSGDRIEAVQRIDRLREPEPLVHFAGTLLPGFIDLHTPGGRQGETSPPTTSPAIPTSRRICCWHVSCSRKISPTTRSGSSTGCRQRPRHSTGPAASSNSKRCGRWDLPPSATRTTP